VFEEINSIIELKKEKLEVKTVDEQKKNEVRKKKEEEELKNKMDEALQEINEIKPNRSFIRDATKKTVASFDRLKARSTRNDLKPEDAKRLVEWANSIISDLQVSIKTDLVSKINDEGQNYLQKLKNEVGNKFNIEKLSLEEKTFNAQLLNKINVLDIRNIDAYEKTKNEQKKREVKKEVRSTNFFKRLFGFKDTKIVIESYTKSSTVVNISKLYNDEIGPKSKQFDTLIEKCENECDKIFQEYNNSFQNLVKSSFEEAKNSVYKNFNDKLALNEKEIANQTQKLREISNTILEFKIQ
jgi:hypothetical protein